MPEPSVMRGPMRAPSSASTSAADTRRAQRSTTGRAWIVVALLIIGGLGAAAQDSQSAAAVMDRAVSDFFAAKIPESVAGFDRVAKMVPREAPELWQRGIALY